MKSLFAVTVILFSPVLSAATYIHNSLPHVYGNTQVHEKEGYISYKSVNGEQLKMNLSDVSETTEARVNGVKKNEVAILDGNICQAFYVAKNGRAEFTCRTGITYTDSVFGKTHHLKKIVRNTSDAIPEVKEIEGMRKGDFVKLQVSTDTIDSGEEVRIEAVLANGQLLVRRTGFLRMALISGGGPIVRDISVVKVNVADVCKCPG